MRLGYSYWGFLGDQKMNSAGEELSTPDGNATYSWSIIHEAQKRGWDVYAMQQDRDAPGWDRMKSSLFSAFSKVKRTLAYANLIQTDGVRLPDLDVLLVEWRWQIFGKNCEDTEDGLIMKAPGLDPDYHRQFQLLTHYAKKGTKLIVWDLDHKFGVWDEAFCKQQFGSFTIFETSRTPRRLTQERIGVEPPTVVSDLLEHITLPSDPHRKLVYVGSRYERDDVIEEWIKPVSTRFPGEIEFWGNWTRPETLAECKKMWPDVSYNGRITTKDFRRAYGTAVACPLLAKKSYLETGFITPRPWEALQFGTIPVGLAAHHGVENYVLEHLIARDPQDMIDVVDWLSNLNEGARKLTREANVEKLQFMDVKHFVDKIERAS